VFIIVPERVEVPFENHSTPIKRGEKYGHKEYSLLEAFPWRVNANEYQVDDTLLDIYYPKPMDVYHPKDQHMCTHFVALGHWNALTLSS